MILSTGKKPTSRCIGIERYLKIHYMRDSRFMSVISLVNILIYFLIYFARKLETYGPPSYTQPQVQLFYPPPPPPPPPPVIQPALTYGPLPLNLTYQQPTQVKLVINFYIL